MSKSKSTRVCPMCGGVNDSKGGSYCKRCHVVYQQDRMRINAGTKCAAPGCKGKRTATRAYCKACSSKRDRKYYRKRRAKMTPEELVKQRKKARDRQRAQKAKRTKKQQAEYIKRARETKQARLDSMTKKERAEFKRKQREYQRAWAARAR